MTWTTVVAVGGAVTGGLLSSNASQNAANTQSQAAIQASNNQLAATTQSNQLQAAMYGQGMMNQSPYMQTGQEALAALTAGLGINNYGVNSGVNTLYGYGGTPNYSSIPGMSSAGIVNMAGQGGTSVPNNGASNGIPASIGGTQGAAAPVNSTNSFNNSSNLVTGTNGINSPSSLLPINNYGANNNQLQTAAASQLTPSGQGALSQVFTPSDLTLSPAYQFQLQQGTANLNASAAATGMFGSGQNLKDITNYGQNAAQNAYQAAYSNFNQNQNQAVSRLQSLAGIGQSATNTSTAAGTATGQGIANTTMAGTTASNNYLTGAAAAQAAGQVGTANAWTGAINNGVNNAIGLSFLNTLNNNGANNAALTSAMSGAANAGAGAGGLAGLLQ
jgi:hypothetical protein